MTGEIEPPRIAPKPWIVVLGNAIALVFGALVVWAAFHIGTSLHLNMLVCALGGLIGWLIGALASPFNKAEEARFLSLGQAISAFVSGYLISKLDRFLELALFTKEGIHDAAWGRAGLFVGSFLFMAILAFMNRTYFLDGRDSS